MVDDLHIEVDTLLGHDGPECLLEKPPSVAGGDDDRDPIGHCQLLACCVVRAVRPGAESKVDAS